MGAEQDRRGLTGDSSLDAALLMVEDRSASVNRWTGLMTRTTFPFGREAEARLRDTLSAVESEPTERVKAAVGLAALSLGHVEEAAGALEGLATGTRSALADLGRARRERIVGDAARVVADRTVPSGSGASPRGRCGS
ncbi:hypothetical protein ACFQV2_07380 [Actinokineospora soli]|uniref:HEAT repeat-containing protein n=1 Tax=Actinokineospora soli TaxID=1048753 RepID=A0ABW2TI78_9PSEU